MNKQQKTTLITLSAISLALGAGYLLWITTKKIVPKNKLKSIADKDVAFWKDKSETNASASNELLKYWKVVGKNFTEQNMQSTSFHKTWPWSAAYISSVVKRWINSESFSYSPSHSMYVIQAREAKRKNDKSSTYWAYGPNEMKAEVGDIIVLKRGQDVTLESIRPGVPLHGDIVVEVTKDKVYVQGGNLSNKVKRFYYPSTNGYINKGPEIVAHLKIRKYD